MDHLKSHSKHNDYNQYVTFQLNKDVFGIEVLHIREVIYICEYTHLPNTLQYMRGVIDLRGTIIPLVDLRIKFNLPKKNYNDDTVILITETHNMLIGFIVDKVFDVLNLELEKYHVVPHFTETIDKDSVAGIAQSNDELIIILDIAKIFSDEDLKGLEKTQSQLQTQLPIGKAPIKSINI